jgi:hypothetical protein
MSEYRIDFYGQSGAIHGRSDLAADDDRNAMVIAELLCEACSDICATFELYRGAIRVDTSFSRMPQPTMSAAQIKAATQESLLRSEEAIRDSGWAVARSHRLLERIDTLRKLRTSKREEDRRRA